MNEDNINISIFATSILLEIGTSCVINDEIYYYKKLLETEQMIRLRILKNILRKHHHHHRRRRFCVHLHK